MSADPNDQGNSRLPGFIKTGHGAKILGIPDGEDIAHLAVEPLRPKMITVRSVDEAASV